MGLTVLPLHVDNSPAALCARPRSLADQRAWNPPAPLQGWHAAMVDLPNTQVARCSSPMPLPTAPRDCVHLHPDTGSALYTTRAIEGEIQRANANLKQAGQRSRFVSAKHLMHHRQAPEG
jgi:hypothetical protein